MVQHHLRVFLAPSQRGWVIPIPGMFTAGLERAWSNLGQRNVLLPKEKRKRGVDGEKRKGRAMGKEEKGC